MGRRTGRRHVHNRVITQSVVLVGLALRGGAVGVAEGQDAAITPARWLIEFGWDEPDTSFLRRHVDAMEQTPFDGCVFHLLSTDAQGGRENFTWLGWGQRAFTEAELE